MLRARRSSAGAIASNLSRSRGLRLVASVVRSIAITVANRLIVIGPCLASLDRIANWVARSPLGASALSYAARKYRAALATARQLQRPSMSSIGTAIAFTALVQGYSRI